MPKILKVLAGVALAALLATIAFSWYYINFLSTELKRKQTEPARQAKLKKLQQSPEEPENEEDANKEKVNVQN